ncbi:sensor histidine kinase [Paenibacillus taichungensis]|uniref:sensor histidine kinase n=1 Tax=Paenibacillus taichungensis TaxID=484184 RepID=UPI0038D163E9
MKAFLFKTKQVKLILIMAIVLLTILGFLNQKYYNSTREALIFEQVQTMQAEALNISFSIQMSHKGERSIENLINENVMPSSLREVTVFDPSSFLKQQEKLEKVGDSGQLDQGILFGTYHYNIEPDYNYVREAYETNKELSVQTEIDGKPILKAYFPLRFDYGYAVIIGLVSDLSKINSYMASSLLKMQLLVGLTTVFILIGLAIISRYYTSNKTMVIQWEQAAFFDNMDQLLTSIKEQRHDFNNQMSTIQSLVATEEYEELRKFTDEMIGEATIINDIIKITSPVLAGLIQAKTTLAIDQKITFYFEISNMQIDILKSTDLVKIISNLIDNAFDAVQVLPEPERIVELTGYLENDRLIFKVFSSGVPIPEGGIDKLFEKGFSTKKDTGDHSGLGLYIVQKIVNRYHGRITVDPKANGNMFTISIPIH